MRLPQSKFSLRVFCSIVFTFNISMLSAAAQQLTCSPVKVRFGTVVIGQKETDEVILTNSGSTSIKISAMSVSGSEFKASALTLPLSLAAGQSVAVNVTFAPSMGGSVQGTVTFTSNASNSSLQLALAGSGAKRDNLVPSPTSIPFGQVTIGSKSTLPVTLTNMKSSGMNISNYQTYGTGFSVTGPPLPISLGAGQSIKLQLTFSPSSVAPSGGYAFISGPNESIPLTGTGISTTSQTGQLSITPSPMNFGNVNVGSSATQAMTLTASGASVTISSNSSSNSQFVLNGLSLPVTLAAGQSSSFNVAFTPTVSGTISGSLSFTSNASNSQLTQSLSGTGVLPQHSVALTWDPSAGASGYNVYRSTTPTGTFVKLNPTMNASTAFTDKSVTSGQTYYYEATALNSSGQESVPSSPPVPATIP